MELDWLLPKERRIKYWEKSTQSKPTSQKKKKKKLFRDK